MERTHICGGCGSREDVGYLVDATIAALQAKLEDLTAKYQNLVAWYDKQNGTPCEQVRHRQEVEALQARLDERQEFIKDCDIALDRIQAPRTNEGQEELVSTWRRVELVGSLLSQYRSTLEQMSTQLTQRTAERDTARRRVDELEAREVDVVLLRDDLEQRTAELEAAVEMRDGCKEPNCPQCTRIADAIDRLAQEG